MRKVRQSKKSKPAKAHVERIVVWRPSTGKTLGWIKLTHREKSSDVEYWADSLRFEEERLFRAHIKAAGMVPHMREMVMQHIAEFGRVGPHGFFTTGGIISRIPRDLALSLAYVIRFHWDEALDMIEPDLDDSFNPLIMEAVMLRRGFVRAYDGLDD